MNTFNSSMELVRIIILLGAVAAMLYKKNTGITPGGIIVPASLARILDASFEWFIVVLLITAVCAVFDKIVLNLLALSRHWTIIINVAIGAVLTLIIQQLHRVYLPFTDITAFGFVLPGLIASACFYQPAALVAKATLLVTAFTYSIGWILFTLIPYNISSKLTVQLASFAPLTIQNPGITIVASLLLAAFCYRFFNARSGGYLISPVVAAMISSSLVQFGLFLLGVAVAFLLVKLFQRYSLVVGIDRFVFTLFLTTIIVTLIDMYAVAVNLDGYRSSALIAIIAMSVWVNDLCLQPLKKTATGFPIPLWVSYNLVRALR